MTLVETHSVIDSDSVARGLLWSDLLVHVK